MKNRRSIRGTGASAESPVAHSAEQAVVQLLPWVILLNPLLIPQVLGQKAQWANIPAKYPSPSLLFSVYPMCRMIPENQMIPGAVYLGGRLLRGLPGPLLLMCLSPGCKPFCPPSHRLHPGWDSALLLFANCAKTHRTAPCVCAHSNKIRLGIIQ